MAMMSLSYVIQKAKRNAKNAGVAHLIQFKPLDVAALDKS